MEERNYEAEAKEQGWNPDYDGPNKTDAQTFVERGEKIAGILKSRLDKQEAQIAQLQETHQKFGEYHKQTLEKQRKQAEARIASLEEKLAQSITDGDGQAYTQINREIDSLKSNQAQDPTDDMAAWQRLSQGWINENEWYAKNPKLAAYADGISDRIRAEGFNGTAYFSELTRRVKEDFPEEFTNPNKAKGNTVEDGGQLSTGSSKEHTYENLDAEAKRACDDFVKGGFMTREDYVKQYEWED